MCVSTAALAHDDKKLPLLDPNMAPETLKVTIEGAPGGVLPLKNVFNSFGCTGGNESPAIKWTGAPKDTQSFALIVHDPDAPTGVGFFHWTIVNLPKTTTGLAANASATGLPAGALQAYTDYGMSKYGGPCPPPGPAHRYIFTVYALKTPKLEVGAGTTAAVLRFMLRDATLALGRAVATYGK